MRLFLSFAVEQQRVLKQVDFKNAFCQGILPPDKITIVKPPIGDPELARDKYWLLKQTRYGLCRDWFIASCCSQEFLLHFE